MVKRIIDLLDFRKDLDQKGSAMIDNNDKIDASKHYSNFSGLLIGFSITFTTLLLTLSTQEIKDNIFFEYAIAAFIISAFAFLQSSEFFIYFIRIKNDINYDLASFFYYIGYISMVFGVIYLLRLFDIYLALWVSYLFLAISIYYIITDYIVAIKRDKKVKDILCLILIMIIYFSIIYYTLIIH